MFSTTSRISWAVVLLAAAVAASACKDPRPRVRPIEGGAVDTGAGSLESVRRQLQGTWNLASAEVVAADGTRRQVKASAVMTYDEFGNMSLKGAFEDPTVGADHAATLNFTGRAVIDVQKRELRLLEAKQSESEFAALPPELNAARVRGYVFGLDTVTMTVKNAKGQVTAVNTWRKTK